MVAAALTVRVLVERGGPEALAVIHALIREALDDTDLAYAGAGPLEDLVHAHGDALAPEIERLARTSPRFGAAFRAVCLPDHLTDRLAPFQER